MLGGCGIGQLTENQKVDYKSLCGTEANGNVESLSCQCLEVTQDPILKKKKVTRIPIQSELKLHSVHLSDFQN